MLMLYFLLLLILISSLISVAFYTVLERKILGYIQIRKGPNKVGFLGIFQPFSDAIKLFSKSIVFLESSNKIIMLFSPSLSFILSLYLWSFFPFAFQGILDSQFSVLAFFIISSISVYAIMMIGWSSNSKYCYIGTIRSIAQMISYEVSFFLIIISVMILSKSFSFLELLDFQYFSPLIILVFPIFMIWFISCIAETNRSPFDFAEGESELVSGFNVEYMSGWFALIFLAEYLSMISLCLISVIMFLGSLSYPLFLLISIILASLFLWVRGTLPRFRYDLLMNLNWKFFLPIVTIYVIFSFSLPAMGL